MQHFRGILLSLVFLCMQRKYTQVTEGYFMVYHEQALVFCNYFTPCHIKYNQCKHTMGIKGLGVIPSIIDWLLVYSDWLYLHWHGIRKNSVFRRLLPG